MAKRIIHECDLTKKEFDPEIEQVFILSISKRGKRGPMKYELSASAAEKLLSQLNGRNPLDQNWSFAENENLPIQYEVDEPPQEENETFNGCRHLNRGPIQTTLRKGKRHIYRKCSDCKKSVPEKTAAEKNQYFNQKLPPDVRLKE